LVGRGHGDALIFRDEDNLASRMSWEELTELVSRLQQALRARRRRIFGTSSGISAASSAKRVNGA
jgi:macrodomain Ter protein organizer (MatP/YcbG family)